MLFDLENVSYTRGGALVISDFSARIPLGATSLVGPSGSGKSTLLRLLCRLADPDSGTIAYEGRDVRDYDVLSLRREVCLVPQLPALIDGTVADNIAYGPRLAGRSFDSAACIELAGLEASFASREVSRLSVGERQRVMLARALALQPRVLLLDEPTSALDADARDAVEAALRGLRERTAISLVVVSHDPAQARRLAEHAVRIEGGRVVASGKAAEVVSAADVGGAGAGRGPEEDAAPAGAADEPAAGAGTA